MDKKQDDKRTTEGQDIKSPEAEVEAPRKIVSQTSFAKGLRQAILTAALREGFRAVFKAMMDAIGIDFEPEPEKLTLPDVEDLFDGIEVIEPMENDEPE